MQASRNKLSSLLNIKPAAANTPDRSPSAMVVAAVASPMRPSMKVLRNREEPVIEYERLAKRFRSENGAAIAPPLAPPVAWPTLRTMPIEGAMPAQRLGDCARSTVRPDDNLPLLTELTEPDLLAKPVKMPELVVRAEKLEDVFNAKSRGLLRTTLEPLPTQSTLPEVYPVEYPVEYPPVFSLVSPLTPQFELKLAPELMQEPIPEQQFRVEPYRATAHNANAGAMQSMIFRQRIPYQFNVITHAIAKPELVGSNEDVPLLSVEQLLQFQQELASTGNCDFDLMTRGLNGSLKNWLFGEPRIIFARELLNLLNLTVAMYGKPIAKFGMQTRDEFGKAVMEWLSRAVRSMGHTEAAMKYAKDKPGVFDENVINRPLLRLMCASVQARKYLFGIIEKLPGRIANLFKLSVKISILKSWDDGAITLNPAEQEALCTLKVVNLHSAEAQLSLFRQYAITSVLPSVPDTATINKNPEML